MNFDLWTDYKLIQKRHLSARGEWKDESSWKIWKFACFRSNMNLAPFRCDIHNQWTVDSFYFIALDSALHFDFNIRKIFLSFHFPRHLPAKNCLFDLKPKEILHVTMITAEQGGEEKIRKFISRNDLLTLKNHLQHTRRLSFIAIP